MEKHLSGRVSQFSSPSLRVCVVFKYLSLLGCVPISGLLSTSFLRGKKLFMAVQHCHQWVLIPIYLHLCGTNPSVHSWTIKGNHRLPRRTTAACHNRLSNEALTGYQSQNKERAAGLWKPNLLNKKLHNTAYESGHPYSVILRDGSILKNICGGAARTTFLCFSKTSVKEIGAEISLG